MSLRHLKRFTGLLLLLILVGIPSFTGQAATFDIPNGDVAALIAAINQANASAGKDEINLAPGGTYSFTQKDNEFTVVTNNQVLQYGPNALPQINSNITINGNGATLQRDPILSSCNGGNELRLFWVNFGAKLTLNNVNVKNSCVGGDLGDGGAIFAQGGTVTVIGSTFENNQVAAVALEGGAITVEGGTLLVEGSIFTGNKAANSGGAILVESSTGIIVNSTFTSNHSDSIGGAVAARFNADVLIVGGLMTSNTAVEGGAVAVTDNALLKLRGVNLSGNTVEWEGGAAYARDSELIVTGNTVFDANIAGMGGGAISTREGSNATIFNSTFNGNIATATMGGGAINHLGANLKVVNSMFNNNKANDSMWGGGAVYHNGDRAVFINSNFNGNTSAHSGGAIYSVTTLLDITGSTFVGNSGRFGGAVSDGGSVVAIHTSTFSNNTATEGNAGAFFGEDTNLLISSSTFDMNSASGVDGWNGITGGGGAVFLTTAANGTAVPAVIVNSTFSMNVTPGKGGAIYAEESVDMSLFFSTLTGNSAAVKGGGISATTNSAKTDSPIISASIIVGNNGGDCDNSQGTAYATRSDNVFGTGCTSGAGDTVGANVNNVLDTMLTNNGGLTRTHALKQGSPAIDKGGTSCTPGDQRRFGRVGLCDAGAFEFNGTPAALPAVVVAQTGGTTVVSEAGATDSYTLVLTHEPTNDVVVNILADSEVKASTTAVTFTPLNWNVPQTVNVSTAPDVLLEGERTGQIAHFIDSPDYFYNALLVDVLQVTVSADTAGGDQPDEPDQPAGEVVANSSFEDNGVWNVKNATKDKRKCNTDTKTFAHTGNCAFMFKGGANERSQISQKLTNLQLAAGDTLNLSAWVSGKKMGNGGSIRVKVVYSDTTSEKLNLTINTGSYAYTQLTHPTVTLAKPVSSIKLTVRNRSTSGRFLIDDLSFAKNATAGLMALPEANQ